jgi:hypothetical protein
MGVDVIMTEIRILRSVSLRIAIILSGLFISIIPMMDGSIASAAPDQEPPFRCSTSPSWDFTRWHYSLWSFCATDSYGPPEWMYWNYLPGTPGYNNPGVGPYYNLVSTAVYDWASVQTNFKLTYKSGDWNNTTDLFVWKADLGGNLRGTIIPYWCTSSTNCTQRTQL